MTWTDPAGWQKLPPTSPMRKAGWRVPRAAGDSEDGEATLFFFGSGQGGSVDASVDRWLGQFPDVEKSQAKRADREANGLSQHVVEIERGTYGSGMPGGPTAAKKDWALVGAIVKAPSGSYFFKLTGPAKTVAAARATFFTLLDGVKTAP